MSQKTINWSEAKQVAKEQQKAELKRKKEFEQTLVQARSEVFTRMYSDEPFSYSDIEDIMNGYGLEMDYIEDMIL